MAKVVRTVLADGDYHEVACAVLSDGATSPAVELLELLDQGMWPDPSAHHFPDSRQAADRSRLIAEIEYLADHGEPLKDYDYLHQGIWEFKIGTLRVTFYDTLGDGSFTVKTGTRNDSHWAKRRFDFPEHFDEYVWLGHYFGKSEQKTRKSDLIKALVVREEDLKHDRN